MPALRKTVIALALLFVPFIALTPSAYAQEPNPEFNTNTQGLDVVQCAEDLSEYVGTVLENVNSNLNHVKLTSPAWNITSVYEKNLFALMWEKDGGNGAVFNKGPGIEYWSGNSYSLGGKPALAFFDEWTKITNDGRPFIFTEFGDFCKNAEYEGNNGAICSDEEYANKLKLEYELAYNRNQIAGVLYFNGLGTNNFDADGNGVPDFQFSYVGPDLLNEITSYQPNGEDTGKGGVNSALPLQPGRAFVSQVQSALQINDPDWTLEIIFDVDVKEDVIRYVNGMPEGVNPIIRLCAGHECDGFEDPFTLANFINDIDRAVKNDVWIIIGPNEPVAENWVCKEPEDREWEWYYWPDCSANTALDAEFHSLRPYPGNNSYENAQYNNSRPPLWYLPITEGSQLFPGDMQTCPWRKKVELDKMCANSIIPEEEVEFSLDYEFCNEDDPQGDCDDPEVSRDRCIVVDTRTEVAEYRDCDSSGNCSTNTREIEFRNWTCENITFESELKITVDLTEAELPVMGNTEDVPNAENGFLGMSKAQRVNNYMSWYLQGIDHTAEDDYEVITPFEFESDRDYAGPVQRLLPDVVLEAMRTEEVENYLYTCKRYGYREHCGYVSADPIEQPSSIKPTANNGNVPPPRDQIVVCLAGTNFPEACYSNENQRRLRRSQVSRGTRIQVPKPTADFIGEITDATTHIGYPYIPISQTEDEPGFIRTKDSSNQPKKSAQETQAEYLGLGEVYEVTGFNTNYLDVRDQFGGINGNINTSDLKLWDELYYAHVREVTQLSTLLQLSYLPGLYKQDEPGFASIKESGRASGLPDAEEPVKKPFCKIEDAFNNPGDNLYGWIDDDDHPANYPPRVSKDIPMDERTIDEVDAAIGTRRGEIVRNIEGIISYAGTVDCDFEEKWRTSKGRYEDCRSDDVDVTIDSVTLQPIISVDSGEDHETCMERNATVNICKKTARTAVSVTTESPLLEEIWNRTVYGNWSVFRRLYPRLEEMNLSLPPEQRVIVPGPNPFEAIPGVTNVAYSAGSHALRNADSGPITALAGPPPPSPDSVSGSSAELYFPYLGGMHKYFLEDIQIALRPLEITQEAIIQDAPMCSANIPGIVSAELASLLAEAAEWANIPLDILVVTLRAEGCSGSGSAVDGIFNHSGHVCQYTDEQVKQYSQPGYHGDIKNCGSNLQIEYGPMGLLESLFNPFKNAVNEATGENRSPELCNLKDSVYAAAKVLSASYNGCPRSGHQVDSAPSEWSEKQKQNALTAWAGGCPQPGETIDEIRCLDRVVNGFPIDTSFYCDKLAEWGPGIGDAQCSAFGEEQPEDQNP